MTKSTFLIIRKTYFKINFEISRHQNLTKVISVRPIEKITEKKIKFCRSVNYKSNYSLFYNKQQWQWQAVNKNQLFYSAGMVVVCRPITCWRDVWCMPFLLENEDRFRSWNKLIFDIFLLCWIFKPERVFRIKVFDNFIFCFVSCPSWVSSFCKSSPSLNQGFKDHLAFNF